MTNFEEYIRQGEPDKIAKSGIWQAAIGLQKVDNLTPSEYLIETARENIEGRITIDEVQHRIDNYYKTKSVSTDGDDRTGEADTVAARIVGILSNDTFSFSPIEYFAIHRRLFTGIYKFAGKIRDYNITKSEWALGGKTVLYANAPDIRATLYYDFEQEKQYDYRNADLHTSIRHIVKFISGLWQIHPFGEGNTRTTAVFAIKYLRSFGFNVDNALFEEHSRYFRNALVRANYNDLTKNIRATPEYLMRFFGNLLLGESHPLKNRELHLDWKKDTPNITPGVTPNLATEKLGVNDGEKLGVNDGEKLGVKLNKNQLRILGLMKADGRVTISKMATVLSISETAVENNLRKLRGKGVVTRAGSDKTGHWVVKFDE